LSRAPLRTPAGAPAFDFEADRFDRGDVVLAAIGWGEWQLLEESLAQGLACEADADRRGEQFDPDALRAAVVAFRRSRRLLAGDEYLQWLAERSLTTEEVMAHLKREALCRRGHDRLDELLGSYPPTSERLAQTIDAEAILSGRLRSWSERLARCAASRRGLPPNPAQRPVSDQDHAQRLIDAAASCKASGLAPEEVSDRAPRVAGLIAAGKAFRSLVATHELIERRLHEHRLDWQRLVWDEATFRSEGAAREAALMVRVDELALESVAELANAAIRVREAYYSEAPELSNLLLTSARGEVLGPFEADGGWQLARLRERVAVSAEDPGMRERVTDELFDDALARHLIGRVSWHDGH
jgi:hypothetical protein